MMNERCHLVFVLNLLLSSSFAAAAQKRQEWTNREISETDEKHDTQRHTVLSVGNLKKREATHCLRKPWDASLSTMPLAFACIPDVDESLNDILGFVLNSLNPNVNLITQFWIYTQQRSLRFTTKLKVEKPTMFLYHFHNLRIWLFSFISTLKFLFIMLSVNSCVRRVGTFFFFRMLCGAFATVLVV